MDIKSDEELLAVCERFVKLGWVETAFAIKDAGGLRKGTWASLMVKSHLNETPSEAKQEEGSNVCPNVATCALSSLTPLAQIKDVRDWVHATCGSDTVVDDYVSVSFFSLLLQYRDWKGVPSRRAKLLASLRQVITGAKQRSLVVSTTLPSSRKTLLHKPATRKGTTGPPKLFEAQATTDADDSVSCTVTSTCRPSTAEIALASTSSGPLTNLGVQCGAQGSQLVNVTKAWFHPEGRPFRSSVHDYPRQQSTSPASGTVIVSPTQYCPPPGSALPSVLDDAECQEVTSERPHKRCKVESAATSDRCFTLVPARLEGIKIEPQALDLPIPKSEDISARKPSAYPEDGDKVTQQPKPLKRKLVKVQVPDDRPPFPQKIVPPIWSQVSTLAS